MFKQTAGRIGFVLTVSLLAVSSSWAQANTSLRGAVADQTSAVIPKAQLTLTNTATGAERKAVSRPGGDYEFLQVVPGTYRLTVEATGFKRFEANNLQLEVNNPATVNVTLEIGGTTQTVAVTAEAPLLNTVDASVGAVITES